MEAGEVRKRISAVFPEIEVVTVSPLGTGWDSDAWLINEELVFRFALRPGLDEQIKKEERLLNALVPTLPVRLPVPRYIAWDGGKDAFAFSAYPYIPGTPLDESDLNPGQLDAVARDIAAFLTALHTVPSAEAEPLVAPITREVGQPWLLRDRFRIDIFPIFDAEERVAIEDRWDKLTAGMEFPPQLTLIHADLGPDHILLNDEGRLVGVIDWGDVTIGDPALDFAGLDTLLRRHVLTHYRGPRDSGFAQRIEFYQWLRPLHEINFGLYWGGGQQAVDRGIRKLMASVGLT
jgi:aminoglycoside phosphotransferase (APT) family kinase protein